MLTNGCCLDVKLDVCPTQKCTRSFEFPIQMSNKKTIFSRQKSLEDTIQSYCWPIKDIFTVLRALSRYVYLSKDIWERWFFFHCGQNIWEWVSWGSWTAWMAFDKWQFWPATLRWQKSESSEVYTNDVLLYSMSCVHCPVSGPWSKFSTSLELIICQLLLIQIE